MNRLRSTDRPLRMEFEAIQAIQITWSRLRRDPSFQYDRPDLLVLFVETTGVYGTNSAISEFDFFLSFDFTFHVCKLLSNAVAWNESIVKLFKFRKIDWISTFWFLRSSETHRQEEPRSRSSWQGSGLTQERYDVRLDVIVEIRILSSII